MKKWIPALGSVLVLLLSLTASVMAETTTPSSSTTSTSSSSTTETSSTSTTTSTTNPLVDVKFTFNSTDDNSILVRWNAHELTGVSVEGVFIDGKYMDLNDDTSGEFSVNYSYLNGEEPGYYSISFLVNGKEYTPSYPYNFIVNRGNSSDLATSLDVWVKNNRIYAKLTSDSGRIIPGFPIKLYFGDDDQIIAEENTDSEGVAAFKVAAPASDIDIRCLAESQTKDSINFFRSEKIITQTGTDPSDTSTTTSDSTTSQTTTTTRSRVKPSSTTAMPTTTAKSSYATVLGPGTTSVNGDTIGLNISYDSKVLSNFGLSKAQLEGGARLFVSSEFYNSLVGNATSSLMLFVGTSPLEISDHHISVIISNRSKFSRFDVEKTKRLPLDLSLLFVDKANNIATPIAPTKSQYTVSMPIPKSMAGKDYMIVAAATNSNGITRLIETKKENGSIRFTVDSLESIVLLGFDGAGTTNSGFNAPTFAIVMIVIGVLMLVAAFVLLYIFFIRKPRTAPDGTPFRSFPNDRDEVEPSARFDTMANTAPSAAHYPEPSATSSEKPVEGISLGSLASKNEAPPRAKKPSDYDIEL